MRKEERKLYNKGKNSRSARKNITEEQRMVKKIREEAKKEKKKREKQELPNKIKEKWRGFIAGRKIEREIKRKEREHERERRKRILPDEGFGD